MQAYSNPSRKIGPHDLPDIEVFELTAQEAAALDVDLVDEYMKRHEYRMATISASARDKMLDDVAKEEGIKGGWFYWYCFPGCMPDSEAIGPFETAALALAAAQAE